MERLHKMHMLLYGEITDDHFSVVRFELYGRIIGHDHVEHKFYLVRKMLKLGSRCFGWSVMRFRFDREPSGSIKAICREREVGI